MFAHQPIAAAVRRAPARSIAVAVTAALAAGVCVLATGYPSNASVDAVPAAASTPEVITASVAGRDPTGGAEPTAGVTDKPPPITPPGPAQRPAEPGDVDGDGRRDKVRVSGDRVIVIATSAGRLATTVPHDQPQPMQVASVIDADGDGYADIWVRVMSGASTEFFSLVRYDGDRLNVVTKDGAPFWAGLGGSVTHNEQVSCNQAGRLYTRTGDSTDGVTYSGERVKYRFDGSTLVQRSVRPDQWTAEGPALPGLANCGIR